MTPMTQNVQPWPPPFTLSFLKAGERLENDVNDRSAPTNIEVGEGVRMDSVAGFKQFRTKAEVGMRIGDHTTLCGVQFATSERGVIEIGADCYIDGASIIAEEKVTIGDRVVIAVQVTIADSDFHPIDPEQRALDCVALSPSGDGKRPPFLTRPVIVENDVWIGFGAVLLKGVRVGQGVIVGAGSVVTKDVPAGMFVSGNPARVIGPAEDARERL